VGEPRERDFLPQVLLKLVLVCGREEPGDFHPIMAEHVPIVSPLGKKHTLQELNAPRECIPWAVF
jgi:hypothetical protein